MNTLEMDFSKHMSPKLNGLTCETLKSRVFTTVDNYIKTIYWILCSRTSCQHHRIKVYTLIYQIYKGRKDKSTKSAIESTSLCTYIEAGQLYKYNINL